MNEADLLIVVRASFANHTGIAPYKPILQVDDTPAAIGRFTPVSLVLAGDRGEHRLHVLRRQVGQQDLPEARA